MKLNLTPFQRGELWEYCEMTGTQYDEDKNPSGWENFDIDNLTVHQLHDVLDKMNDLSSDFSEHYDGSGSRIRSVKNLMMKIKNAIEEGKVINE